MLILDTNALIWFDTASPNLGRRARGRIERDLAARNAAYSAASIWELAILLRKRRYDLDRSILRWREDLRACGFVEIALDGEMAARSEDFIGLHRDPADRFIAAASACLHAYLMTADKALLAWAGRKGVDANR